MGVFKDARIDARVPGTIFGLYVRRVISRQYRLEEIECLQIVAGFGAGRYILRRVWGFSIMHRLEVDSWHIEVQPAGELMEMARHEFAPGERQAGIKFTAKALRPPAIFSEILCTWHDSVPSSGDAVRELAVEIEDREAARDASKLPTTEEV